MRLTPDQYCEYAWTQVESFIKGIENDTIIHNKWIRLAVKRFVSICKDTDKWDYKVKKVDKVFRFFSFLNIEVNDEWKQFKLLPFQAFFIAAIFGFYYKDTERPKHRYAFLFMARGNGKTPFATALQLFLMVSGGYAVPQSLLVASTREQAGIALQFAKDIVNHSPALSDRIDNFKYSLLFKDRKKAGFLKVLASNANKLDGYKPTSAILDEIHSYPDDSLFNVIKSGLFKKENSLGILISTAGFSTTSFCYNYVEMCKNILIGLIEDDSIFPMLFTLDDGDDISDVNNWYKSNPAMGVTIKKNELEIEYNQARNFTTQRNNFKTKNLNIFVNATTEWISDDEIVKCCNVVDEKELLGKDCYLGIDLSNTRDLSSVVAIFPKEGGKIDVIPYFFMPDNGEKMLRKGNINLNEWISKGHIIKSNQPTINYDQIYDKIVELSEKFNIRCIGYDPYLKINLIPKLKGSFETNEFRQTTSKFTPALNMLDTLIANQNINFGLNPVIRWNFKNVVLYADGNGNIKVMKNKSKDAVDGVVALGIALGTYIDLEVVNEENAAMEAYLKYNT